MPSRKSKLSRSRKLLKAKKVNKRLTKMRGGASAEPGLLATDAHAAPAADVSVCFSQDDPNLSLIGTPFEDYLSDKPYDQEPTMYSDHAPIMYDFSEAPDTFKNEYIKLITWNVAQWGHAYYAASNTYNHKFRMQRPELIAEYERRLVNLVDAMVQLLSVQLTKDSSNHPFLFCQELPQIDSRAPRDERLRKTFTDLLRARGLGLLSDRSILSEFGLIVKLGSKSTRFFVLNKDEYSKITYDGGQRIFDPKEWHRFEIYYYTFRDRTYYYANIHAKYEEYAHVTHILNFLNKIIDQIQLYHNSLQKDKSITIFIIGDYNFNIADPNITTLRKSLTFPNISQLFMSERVSRKITRINRFTTVDAIGYSLNDNVGGRNPCNVDCLLQLDVEWR